MLWTLRRRLMHRKFDWSIRGIFQTPPMPVVPAPLTIVSMVETADVAMYLLSMKAFYRRVGHGHILAIVDRDMPSDARATLERHFPGIRFQILEDIDTGPCQRGGTWERILHILSLAEDGYVVQVDCDTLPVAADIQEVVDCIEHGRAFTLADDNQRIQSMREAADAAQATPGDFIGIVAERMFDRYPDSDRLRYVRGSSGLAGFARGGFPRRALEEFHATMEGLVGPARWREWGTEQNASNFAVANSPDAVVLPYPAYTSFSPNGPRERVKFFHFIGSFRFDQGYFAARGGEEIAALLAPVRRTGT